jgi:hypothetical protein
MPKILAVVHAASVLGCMSRMAMSGCMAVRVHRAMRAADDVAADFHAARMALIREHAELDEAGEPVSDDGAYRIRPDAQKAFDQQYRDLCEDWVTLPAIDIPDEMLEGCRDLTPEMIGALDLFRPPAHVDVPEAGGAGS